jgi:uncharacterized protein involved in type VI secretion and phage assembly
VTSSETVLSDITSIAPLIKVDGSDLPDNYAMAMLSLRINWGLSTTGRATLRFVDNGYDLSTTNKFKLGSAVAIRQKNKPIFAGVVTGTALEHSGTSAPEYVVTVDDQSFKLALSQRIVAWEKMSATDIIRKLADDAGLTAQVPTVDQPTYDYLAQQGSDLAFLDALTRRVNCVWWVDDTSLMVRPAGSAENSVSLKLGGDLLDFSVRASGLRPTAVNINGWDPVKKNDIVGPGKDAAKLTPGATFASKYGGTGPDSAFGVTAAITVNHSNPNTQGEATQLASSLNAMFAADAVVARGTTNINAEIGPHTTVQIDGAGPANGSYSVTEIEHSYSMRGFYTKFVAGPLRQALLVDAFAAPPPDPGFVNYALASAIVSSVGTESNTKGMVKVKFTGGDNKLVSAWARVVSIGGGDKRGSVFLPEINDEVLIGFERGDTRHPVVLGGLFGGQAAMAADDQVFSNGKVAYRRITSRTGNIIELSDGDTDDKKHVKLTSAGGQLLRIGDDKGEITYSSGKPFSIKIGDASIEFDAQGNITIKGVKITIKADQEVDISGVNLSAKASAKLALEGSAESELKGAMVSVDASGIAKVKGSMVNIN